MSNGPPMANFMQELETFSFQLDETTAALKRLDKALCVLAPDYSRARLQGLIDGGHVMLNAQVVQNRSAKIKPGDQISLTVPPPTDAIPKAENILLDIIYEDDDLLVINKQAGLVVHPGAGNPDGTLVNALLHHCKGSLSGIGGVLRPGIVHRLDKETSGLMMAAKNDMAHHGLADQLQDRSLSREYVAITFKAPVPPKGHVEGAIGRHPRQRQKMVMGGSGAKDAKTFYQVEQRFGQACAQIACKLQTGRTHQIRVHMASMNCPLVGDPLYGPQPSALRAALGKDGYEEEVIQAVLNFERQALHARKISFIHPRTQEQHTYEAPLPADIKRLIDILS